MSTAGRVSSPGTGQTRRTAGAWEAVLRISVSVFPVRDTGLMRRTIGGSRLLFLHEVLELLVELGHVLELAVDGGEPHVGDLVELAEPVHDQLTDLGDTDLLVGPLLEEGLDLLDDLLELADLDGPLLAGLHHAPEELLAVEGLAGAVLLDDHVGDLFDLLVGREPSLAGEALPAPPDGQAFLALPRVDDLAFEKAAEGAPHRVSLSPIFLI